MTPTITELVTMAEAAGATIVRSPVATIIVVPVASAVDPGELLPLVDAGRLAGTSPRALKEAARRGELELFGRERSRVVRRGDVLRWVQERRTPIASVADPQQARVERRLARRSHRAA